MSTTPLFEDPVSVAVDYLAEHLDIPVRSQVPNPRPPAFVVVGLHGGIRGTAVSDKPRLGFECWDEDVTAARDRAQLVRALVADMVHHPHTTTVYRHREITAPYDDPDLDSGQARVSQEHQLHLRGAALTHGS